MSSRIRPHVAVLLSICLLGAFASTALAGGSGKAGDRQESRISLRLQGLSGGKLTVGKKIEARGTMRPYVEGQKVTVLLHKGKRKTLKRVTVPVRRKSPKSSLGQFSFSKKLIKPGRYSVEAIHKKNANVGGS